MTIGNAKVIEVADKIYCFGSHGVSHSADTLKELTDEGKITIVDVPMSKDRTKVLAIYHDLALTIAEEQKQGKSIAVATEGDTGIFATSHYVMDMLKDMDIPCEQHAGIPSFIGAAAIANLHLVKLDERLIIIPGETTTEELAKTVANGTNVVIMKLSMATEAIHRCIDMHPEFHYHFFHNIGMADQEYINNPETLKNMDFPYFSLMIIQK